VKGVPALLVWCASLILLVPAGLGQAPGGETSWPTAGWTTSTPEEQGMDPVRLEQASQYIEQSSPTRFSLLVVRNGRLVFERYYHGSRISDANNIKSMSKSVLSVLTGIALEEGRLRSLDQKLHEFFPEYFLPGDDPRKLDITLAHLLTMTAGFEWLESSAISTRCFTSADWHRFVIQSPLTSAPGEVFNYSTGLTHLLSGILTKVSGVGTLAFADTRLFAPLGIACARWSQDPRGYYVGGSEIWLTARDLAKFGLLFLRNGRWDGRTIVSEEWLRTSSQLRIRTGNQMGDYASLWWKYNIQGYPVTFAAGFGGQNVFLVPDLDLMMVTTARSDIADQPVTVYSETYDVLSRYIIPSVNAGVPAIAEGGVMHAADSSARLAPGVFASVFGVNFSLVERTWDYAMPADGRLPEVIAGVRMLLGGLVARPSYVRGEQINFLVPPDLPPGRHTLDIWTPRGRASQNIEVAAFAPAFFTVARDGRRFAALRPVRAGESVDLWASGLGPSEPAAPADAWLTRPLAPARPPEVSVAGQAAPVVYCALTSPGLWQVRIRVPADCPPGIAALELRAGGAANQDGAVLEIAP
jgi:uncharacterized protein (TIGR03437 family)